MKAIFLTVMTSFISLSAVAGNKKVTCTTYPGGYDVETLGFSLGKNSEAMGLSYTNYQGETAKFKKVSSNSFEYSAPELILNYIVTVAPEKNLAVLNVVYKTSGQLLSSSVFECK